MAMDPIQQGLDFGKSILKSFVDFQIGDARIAAAEFKKSELEKMVKNLNAEKENSSQILKQLKKQLKESLEKASASASNSDQMTKIFLFGILAGAVVVGLGFALVRGPRGPGVVVPVSINTADVPVRKLRFATVQGAETSAQAAESCFYQTITVRNPRYLMKILKKFEKELIAAGNKPDDAQVLLILNDFLRLIQRDKISDIVTNKVGDKGTNQGDDGKGKGKGTDQDGDDKGTGQDDDDKGTGKGGGEGTNQGGGKGITMG
ncbi:hypothetical protein ACP275_10G173200 [Erythranthe tilingii]